MSDAAVCICPNDGCRKGIWKVKTGGSLMFHSIISKFTGMKHATKLFNGLGLLLFSLFVVVSCKKDDKFYLKQTDTYSTDVLTKWIDMQARIM